MENLIFFNNKNSKLVSLISYNKFNSDSLIKKWDLMNLELIEFSIRTKFSTLDGISSPSEYIKSSEKKKYKAFVINDHSNVQSFPEFWENRSENEKLKLIYGCEFEMIEDKFDDYLFTPNSPSLSKKISFSKNIDDLVYCIFDIETTGLFSNYDEIIEIGYVIWKDKKIIEKNSYLVKPEKKVPNIIYKLTGITEEDLNNAEKFENILEKISENWEKNKVDVLVSHNAIKFDIPFLSKAWYKFFGKKIQYPVIDTLPLSRIAIPGKKSYSLEKLTQGKNKDKQSHRALEDSLLLTSLFEKLIKIAKEKEINFWWEFESLISSKFYSKGTKIIALAKNKKGLSELYKLVKISGVDNFFKYPFLFRSDIEKNRKNLIIGASGDPESEIFSLFSTFNYENILEKKIKFYDYIEIRGLDCFSHLISSARICNNDLKKILFLIIKTAKEIGVKVVSSNNVHYCDKIQKKIKEIVVLNEGVNGSRHVLYNYVASKDNEKEIDFFKSLPMQHLRSREEIVRNWEFLQNENLIEEIVIKNPEFLIEQIENVKIFEKHIGYPISKSNENELIEFCTKKVCEIFGKKIHKTISERIKKEWKILKKKYLFIYWISWKVVMKAREDKNIVGSRGSVGCSFIAYLLGITDINPLSLYTICNNCKDYNEISRDDEIVNLSCYDFSDKEKCSKCQLGIIKYEGHSLPFETFVGWNGEKIPDIDLNFSGEYQRTAHNYLRDIVGKENIYRIGTVSKLSQQTAENFWNDYKKIRKLINNKFVLKEWFNEFIHLKIFNNQIEIEKFIIDQLKGIKRTTGQHPGGLLIIPPEVKILDFTPVNYPANDVNSEWLTTHFEYNGISKYSFKIDILAHNAETMLQKSQFETGVDSQNISYNNGKIMKDIFVEKNTLGIPEFQTDYVRKNLLEFIMSTTGSQLSHSQLVQINGFAHGTGVWLNNQQKILKEKRLPLDKLLACREDILTLLDSKGVSKEDAFKATELIRKGKWKILDIEIKNRIREKLNDEEGEIYFSILEKIDYIFPKPHAIAYTMTAWKTAYYKVYFPESFYSILLTYHANIYDIWLMTFDVEKAISFRLNKLIENFDIFKTSKKEFISISKVLVKLSKDCPELKKFIEIIFNYEKDYYEIFQIKYDFKLSELTSSYSLLIKKINDKEDTIIKSKKRILFNYDNEIKKINLAFQTLYNENLKKDYNLKLEINKKIIKNFSSREINDWKLTSKEKDLLFTLRVIFEIKERGFDFSIGIDFNNSEINNFKFIKGKMLIPFLAITSIGEILAKKIVNYRIENNIIKDWKNDLKGILNKKNFEEFFNLEKNNLVFQ